MVAGASTIHEWEPTMVSGMLQTADYARHLHVLMWEAALRTLICPPQILVAQLYRLAGVIGMDTVTLGIVPLRVTVRVPLANGFWSFDGRLVITEDWHAELWLGGADTIATYQRVWQGLSESAVFGAEAQHVIAQARRSLDVR
ncbi:Scr1 family TA system antitoxin-like transcriptional regulator [Streptomyces yanii]|uniref:Scr1 family TA system antitoxin-like transcriptional regulator n=1 Tax=Streptomyces yanii TaxID=78510 RepID=A0ABV5R9K4_9ACTN